MTLRVLSWNLYHGRADPPAGRPLFDEFAAMLAGWSWDVALLQEVPPWWAPQLARATDADERRVAGRLVARELELVRAQDQRVAPQLDHAGLERDPRARGRLLEQKRHVASFQGARGVRSRFELERPVEQGVEVVGTQLGAGEEMPRQAREHTRA